MVGLWVTIVAFRLRDRWRATCLAVVPLSRITTCPGRIIWAAARPIAIFPSVVINSRPVKPATAGDAGRAPAVDSLKKPFLRHLSQVATDCVLRDAHGLAYFFGNNQTFRIPLFANDYGVHL